MGYLGDSIEYEVSLGEQILNTLAPATLKAKVGEQIFADIDGESIFVEEP
jgi:hypothetical protein